MLIVCNELANQSCNLCSSRMQKKAVSACVSLCVQLICICDETVESDVKKLPPVEMFRRDKPTNKKDD